MRILIAEDDLTSRMFMKKFMSRFGKCDVANNGMEALDLVMNAIRAEDHYDLICLDIMMPKVDGVKALKMIREIEDKNKEKVSRAKVIMTTALNDKTTVSESYEQGCDAYAWKPIDIEKFTEVMDDLGLLENNKQ